jgi:hypothetical protein
MLPSMETSALEGVLSLQHRRKPVRMTSPDYRIALQNGRRVRPMMFHEPCSLQPRLLYVYRFIPIAAGSET